MAGGAAEVARRGWRGEERLIQQRTSENSYCELMEGDRVRERSQHSVQYKAGRRGSASVRLCCCVGRWSGGGGVLASGCNPFIHSFSGDTCLH